MKFIFKFVLFSVIVSLYVLSIIGIGVASYSFANGCNTEVTSGCLNLGYTKETSFVLERTYLRCYDSCFAWFIFDDCVAIDCESNDNNTTLSCINSYKVGTNYNVLYNGRGMCNMNVKELYNNWLIGSCIMPFALVYFIVCTHFLLREIYKKTYYRSYQIIV